MTLQFNGEMTVITLVNESRHIEGLVIKEKYKHICIYSTVTPEEIKIQVGRGNYIEYLDTFIIILPEDYAFHSIIWDDFYTFYGDFYENMIDVNNNIRCIRKLYSYIKKNIKITNATNILDYGCGSGLSININDKCNLIGYEPNEKMRKQAVKKGIKVYDCQDLYSLPYHFINAVFSSYVFHMGIKDNEIEILDRIICNDGIIIANFYKGINYKKVNNAFRDKGFRVQKVNGFDERFGFVYEYRKKG